MPSLQNNAKAGKHPIVPWIISLTSAALILFMFIAGAANAENDVFSFTWRWFAAPVIVAMVSVAVLYVWVLRITRVRKGAIYWFAMLLAANLVWLIMTLLQTLSATPEAGAFWQGMLPLGWIPVPVFLLFFVLSYIDDTDMPLPLTAWLQPIVAMIVLVFMAGMTNLIENHVPSNISLVWYGYSNEPGMYSSLVLAWVSVLGILSLFVAIKAYRVEHNPIKKRQLRIFVIALMQYILIGFIVDIVLYPFFPHAFPPMSFLYVTSLSIIFAYGIIKYGVFQFNATSLAEPILHNMVEGVIGVNTNFEVEFTNSGARHMLGFEEGTLAGVSIERLFGKQTFHKLMEQLERKDTLAFTVDDAAIVGRQEQHVPVTLNVSRVVDDRNKYAGYIFVMQNITELKKKTIELQHEKENVEQKVIERTQQLHEEQARLKASIEDLALGFMMVDDEGNIIVQNRALQRILGLKKQLGSLAELNAFIEHFNIESRYKKVLATKRHTEAREVAAGAKILHVFMSPVLAAEDSAGSAIGTVILIEDVTEVKVLERSRDEFFSIASHELRTPLTAIRGNASMALQYYKDSLKDPGLSQIVEDIHDSSVRLIDIVNDFLDMSSLEQGRIVFELGECSLEEIIENIVYELKTVTQEKKLTIDVDTMVLDSLPKVWADKNRVKQILYNLVGNAVKFTEPGGNITVNAWTQKDSVKVTISDTGRGIPVDSHKLLFHKFQQAGGSLLTRDATRGTGLGLYISKLLAEKMDGTLVLEKSEEGKGSTFSVTLPTATRERKEKRVSGPLAIDTATGLSIANPQKA